MSKRVSDEELDEFGLPPKRIVTDEQLDEIEKKMRAYLSEKTDVPGLQGTVSRAMVAILPHAARWSAGEYNRETPPNETIHGLMTVVANALASELDNLDIELDVKVEVINEFLREVAQNTLRIMTQKKPGAFTRTTAQEVGHG